MSGQKLNHGSGVLILLPGEDHGWVVWQEEICVPYDIIQLLSKLPLCGQ